MFLEIGGLSEEQAYTVREVVMNHYEQKASPNDVGLVCYSASNNQWGVQCRGRIAASNLAVALMDEDSGADYLT